MKNKTYTPKELLGTENIFGYLKLKDKYYQVTSKDGKPLFKEMKKDKIEDKIKRAKSMAQKLKNSLDAEKVLTEVFMTRFEDKDFDKLYNSLFKSKRKYKAKTREGACVDMKVGKWIIPIIDDLR